ncbi:MAG: YihY/virulence factor BrkB family protein [Defluviitaleaceae bacterium]|nr:YihY/virulence factor BrkB family protein [Defluviitaleaceae bacterium]
MVKFGFFLFNLVIKCNRDRILERAAGLTFRVLLAFFPFLVFLMALMGFMDVDESAILDGLYTALPGDVATLVSDFIGELADTRSTGLLSAALFFSVYNTTNGFRAIIRITNAAYGVRERRGLAAQIGLSFALMFMFSAALIVMLGVLVFGERVLSVVAAIAVLLFFTAAIYRLALAKPVPARYIFPGAVVTVFAWLVVGATFGFVTRNFTQYPAIYGSIAGVFILILWLNAVSIILLAGNEINSMLYEFAPPNTNIPTN